MSFAPINGQNDDFELLKSKLEGIKETNSTYSSKYLNKIAGTPLKKRQNSILSP